MKEIMKDSKLSIVTNIIDKIIEKVENDPLYFNINEVRHVKAESTAEDAITESAKYVARIMSAKAVVTYTTSGSTALRAARERPDVPILSISPNLDTARRLALVWGVHCVHTTDARSFKDMVLKAGKLAKKENYQKELVQLQSALKKQQKHLDTINKKLIFCLILKIFSIKSIHDFYKISIFCIFY